MPDHRDTLALALERDLPEGGWLFLNAAPVAPLADAAHEQPFRPDYLALAKSGRAVFRHVTETGFDGAALLLTRSRRLNEALLSRAWNAVRGDGRVVACGPKTMGVAPLRRWAAARTAVADSFAKHHATAFTLIRPTGEGGEDWPVTEAEPGPDGILRPLGSFSADGPDPASTLLVAHLDALGEAAKVADLGAGWGHLSMALAERGVTPHLYEADHAALEAARVNLDGKGAFHWHDVVGEPIAERFEAVVTNPPFHTGRAADPLLGQRFIERAAGVLVPGGRLLMVANRQLPYERVLGERFRTWEQLADAGGFKVLLGRA